jgi:hypothetical protein
MTSGRATMAAGVCAAMALQATAAAVNDTSAASNGEALRGEVTMICGGTVTRPFPTSRTGRCRIDGAITDAGRFVDRASSGERAVFGRKGTIWMTADGPRWKITGGTRKYARLRRRGYELWLGPCRHPVGCVRFTIMLSGKIWR